MTLIVPAFGPSRALVPFPNSDAIDPKIPTSCNGGSVGKRRVRSTARMWWKRSASNGARAGSSDALRRERQKAWCTNSWRSNGFLPNGCARSWPREGRVSLRASQPQTIKAASHTARDNFTPRLTPPTPAAEDTNGTVSGSKIRNRHTGLVPAAATRSRVLLSLTMPDVVQAPHSVAHGTTTARSDRAAND